MAIRRNKTQQHIYINQQNSELQLGFTKNRRTEDNLFLLGYSIEQSFKMKRPFITIDLKKAFDSVKRSSLINCLTKFKVYSYSSNIVSEIYQNHKVIMYLNNDIMTRIEVTSGKSQGCNGFTTLFLL